MVFGVGVGVRASVIGGARAHPQNFNLVALDFYPKRSKDREEPWYRRFLQADLVVLYLITYSSALEILKL